MKRASQAACLWILFASSLLDRTAEAQNYTYAQRLTPTALGEGQPQLYFGTTVAVDGDVAMVAERPSATVKTLLRGYRRIAGVWQRAPELTIRDSNGIFTDMDIGNGRLVLSTFRPSSGGFSDVAIYRLDTAGWVGDGGGITSSVDTFGASVAVDDDLVVIGSPDSGSVMVRRRANDGSWSSTTLTPSLPEPGSGFGYSVAIVAGAIVVGAPYEDVVVSPTTYIEAGAAYVFELTQDTWTQVNRLTATTPESNARFGWSVAISGLDPSTPDRMLVGAPREGNTNGAVYAFKRGTSNWASSFRLADAQTFQQFGFSVAMDGDYAVIGARDYDVAGLSNAGAVYGADFNGSFSSAVLTRRSDPLPATNSRVGDAVAIDRSGPTVLVGVPNATLYGNNQQGIVLLSRGTSTALPFPNLGRVFDLGQGLYGARFGTALSADGDALLVGAPFESVGNQQLMGAAYLYRQQSNGDYALETRLQSPSGLTADFYGMAVALKGDIALIGAPGEAGAGTADLGKVYVYRRVAGIWNLEAQLFSACDSTDGRRNFGRSIAFDGTRALVGGICPPQGSPGNDLGTQVFTRQVDGTWQSGLIAQASRMGAGAWDAGMAIVGLPVNSGADNNFVWGSVFAFLPNGSDWNLVGSASSGSVPTQGYGFDVSADNGALAVTSAAPNFPVNVFRRSGNSFLPEASLIATDLGVDDATQKVALSGNRIAFGAHLHTVSQNEQGAVYLFEKRNGAWAQQQKLLAGTAQVGAHFGAALAMNASGLLIVGANDYSGDFYDQGTVYVYAPPPDLLFQSGFEP
jgi:FG-GAP repeat